MVPFNDGKINIDKKGGDEKIDFQGAGYKPSPLGGIVFSKFFPMCIQKVYNVLQ